MEQIYVLHCSVSIVASITAPRSEVSEISGSEDLAILWNSSSDQTLQVLFSSSLQPPVLKPQLSACSTSVFLFCF